MLFTTRATVALVATASAAIASTSSVTPLASVGLDLAIIGNTTEHSLGKRSVISGVLCGIGIISSCPVGTTVNTLVDTSNCETSSEPRRGRQLIECEIRWHHW